MVLGLPKTDNPNKVCEESVEEKQHKNNFSNDAGSKSKEILEIIYSDVCGPIQVDLLGGNIYFVTFIYDFSQKNIDLPDQEEKGSD